MPDFKFITDDTQRQQAIDAHKLEVDELTVNLGNKSKEDMETAVGGLKTKNAEILNEKKELQATALLFDGIDPEAARTSIDFHTKYKDAEFLKDGNTVEDLIEKKTSQLNSDHEAAVGELTGKLVDAVELGGKFKGLYNTKVIEDSLREAALKAKVLPKALIDVLLRGKGLFSLNEQDGSVEARGKDGKLLKINDETVMTTGNWIESLKKTSPHYWPGSESSGAHGGEGDANDLQERINVAAGKGDSNEVRRLRKKQRDLRK